MRNDSSGNDPRTIWQNQPTEPSIMTMEKIREKIAIAWSLAGQYFLKRGVWSATLPRDAALSTGLESYRREVERRRYISGHFLLWSLAPVVLALATFIVPLLNLGIRKEMLFNMIPFLVLSVLWIAGVFVIRVRDQRELQREIDELNDIERENRR